MSPSSDHGLPKDRSYFSPSDTGCTLRTMTDSPENQKLLEVKGCTSHIRPGAPPRQGSVPPHSGQLTGKE